MNEANRTNKTRTTNAEAMMRALIAQKSSKKNFRLPLTTQQAFDMLLTAYKAEVVFRRRKFVEDEATRENVMRLAEFLTSEPGKFGFMLVGNCGNGKTTLLYAFQNLLNCLARFGVTDGDCGIMIQDAREITELAKNYDRMKNLKRTPMLAIEDMGRESTEVMDFGNVYSPVVDLLEYRYDRQLFTAFTSNLSVDELTAKYGKRIADRFREMFAKVVFKNKTYR